MLHARRRLDDDLVADAVLGHVELAEPFLLRSASAPANLDLREARHALHMQVARREFETQRGQARGVDVERALRGEGTVVRERRCGGEQQDRSEGQAHDGVSMGGYSRSGMQEAAGRFNCLRLGQRALQS